MKLKIEFEFGMGFRENGDAILFHEQCDGLKEICDRAVSLFDGYTKYNTGRAWWDSDADIVTTEESCTISVIVDDSKTRWELKLDEDVLAMVQQIKASLQQKAVAVTRQIVQFHVL